jgi:carbonic anhydrase
MGEKLISADEALRKLLEGNGRFVKGQPESPRRSPEDFRELAEAQYPKAVIVTCADSRVAPEIAVKAAMNHIEAEDSLPGAINGLVELIKPAVAQSKGAHGDLLENAIRKNVEIGIERLKELRPILAPRVKDGKVKVVGALYDLRAGVVTMVETPA